LEKEMYKDKCVICGRELIAPGEKKYLGAYQIRRLFPGFHGHYIFGEETGAFVCRSKKKCRIQMLVIGVNR